MGEAAVNCLHCTMPKFARNVSTPISKFNKKLFRVNKLFNFCNIFAIFSYDAVLSITSSMCLILLIRLLNSESIPYIASCAPASTHMNGITQCKHWWDALCYFSVF